MNNSPPIFWNPEELTFPQISNPIPEEHLIIFAKNIAAQQAIDHGVDYHETYEEVFQQAKAYNEMIKAQCQPRSM